MRRLAALVVALLTLTLAACGGDAATQASAGPEVEITEGTTVIDVRTPSEFAEGHLEGAVNIDVSAPDFADRIGELDPAGTYVVYCRSGNRSAAAVEEMAELGFTDLTDAGGVDEAAEATGLAIVTD